MENSIFKPKNEDLKCAPSKKYSDESCFTIESLKRMSKAYNNKIKERKFKGDLIDIKNDKKHLVLQLTDRLKDVCDDQICWLKQDFIKEIRDFDAQENTFRPEGPQGRFDWLSTSNIDDIMIQYEEKYPDFKYFGALPYDFDDLPFYGVRKLNFDKLISNGITRIGFVFNFDEHWQSGSHWVSMFVNLDKDQIYYFDSYGHRPRKNIRTLVNRIGKWCYKRHITKSLTDSDSMTEQSFMQPKKLNYIERKINSIKYNKIRHQFKHSECGIYSVNFILRLLKGETFDFISNNITTDDQVNKCRETYFRFT